MLLSFGPNFHIRPHFIILRAPVEEPKQMSLEELKKQREAEKAARDAKLKEKSAANTVPVTKTLNATTAKTLSSAPKPVCDGTLCR